MIIGRIETSEKLERLHPLLKKVFAFLRECDLSALPLGRTDIDGNRAYVKVEEVEGKSRKEAAYERHFCYTDIHVPISGDESYGWMPWDCCLTGQDLAYDRNRDIVFYEQEVERVFTLRPGEFALFFPEDCHAPCIGRGTLRKAVVKVLMG